MNINLLLVHLLYNTFFKLSKGYQEIRMVGLFKMFVIIYLKSGSLQICVFIFISRDFRVTRHFSYFDTIFFLHYINNNFD